MLAGSVFPKLSRFRMYLNGILIFSISANNNKLRKEPCLSQLYVGSSGPVTTREQWAGPLLPCCHWPTPPNTVHTDQYGGHFIYNCNLKNLFTPNYTWITIRQVMICALRIYLTSWDKRSEMPIVKKLLTCFELSDNLFPTILIHLHPTSCGLDYEAPQDESCDQCFGNLPGLYSNAGRRI